MGLVGVDWLSALAQLARLYVRTKLMAQPISARNFNIDAVPRVAPWATMFNIGNVNLPVFPVGSEVTLRSDMTSR